MTADSARDDRRPPTPWEPMRPVDLVHEPPRPDAGFWFSPGGRRGWILPVLFGALIVLSGLLQTVLRRDWTTTIACGTTIVVVMLVVNEVLKRALRG